MPPSPNRACPANAAFAMRLARNIKGEVLFDRASRGRYATDASIYQVEPVGVIVPEAIDDVVAALSHCARRGRAGAGARRRHQPMRPDGQPRAGDRLLEASAPHSARRSAGERPPWSNRASSSAI